MGFESLRPNHAAAVRYNRPMRWAHGVVIATALQCGGRVSSDDCPCGPPSADGAVTIDAAVDATLDSSSADASASDVDVEDAPPVDAALDAGPCGVDHHVSHGVCLADDASADLPSVEACVDAGNVLWVDGDPGAYIYTGTSDLVNGSWAVGSESYGAPDNGALLEAHYANSASVDPWWFLLFRDGPSLAPGVVYHASSASSANPGLEIQFGSNGCYAGATQYFNPGEGAFRIDELDAGDASLNAFSGAFWILCDKASGVLRGCLRYAR